MGERIWRVRGTRLIALPVALRRLLTFHLVCIGWVLFRAPDLGTAWLILTRMAQWRLPPDLSLAMGVCIALLAAYSIAHRLTPAARLWLRMNLRGAVGYAAIVVTVLLFSGRRVDFIYFQF